MPTSHHPAFSAIAPHYDLLMKSVPYYGWVYYLKRLLEVRNVKPVHVLDLACGTGNVSEILAREGMLVTGVDISPEMIRTAVEKARSANLSIDYLCQDGAELHLDRTDYDLCVSLFDSLNYVLEPERLQKALHRVYAHLTPGGLFVVDMNSEFALENHFFDQRNMDTSERVRYEWNSVYDKTTRLCEVNMRFLVKERSGEEREFWETHRQFAYREGEVREMLACAGFERISCYHGYSLKPVRATTDRIFYVASRP